jgi:hypothetical protein
MKLLGSLLVALFPLFPGDAKDLCAKDIDFALDALPKKCGQFFELKKIDWKAVSVDTLIKVAEERLKKYPQDKVRYDPAKAGWKAKK